MKKYMYRHDGSSDDVIYWFDNDILYLLDHSVVEISNYNSVTHRHKIATQFHSYTLGTLIRHIREYDSIYNKSFPKEHLKAILIQISQENP